MSLPRPSQHIRQRIYRCLFGLVAGYVVLLSLSYLLLFQARSSWDNADVYWETVSAVAVDVNHCESMQHAIDVVGERPAIYKEINNLSTGSLLPWDVLGTWLKVREHTTNLKISTESQLDWISAVIQAESRMNENTAN